MSRNLPWAMKWIEKKNWITIFPSPGLRQALCIQPAFSVIFLSYILCHISDVFKKMLRLSDPMEPTRIVFLPELQNLLSKISAKKCSNIFCLHAFFQGNQFFQRENQIHFPAKWYFLNCRTWNQYLTFLKSEKSKDSLFCPADYRRLWKTIRQPKTSPKFQFAAPVVTN